MQAVRSSHTDPMPPQPGWLEGFYILVALLLVTQALVPLVHFGGTSAESLGDSNPVTLLSALVVYAIALLLLLRRPRAMLQTVRIDPLLIILFMLPVMSIIWSVDQEATLRRAIALVMTGIFCVYIAQRLSPDEFLRRLLLALFIGGVLSLLYTAAFPADAIEHSSINTGSWKGVYGHKAMLGRIAAIAVTVSIYVRPRYPWESMMRWATIAIFLFLSIQSQSRASWLMMMGGICFMLLIAILRNGRLSNGIKLAVAIFVGSVTLLCVAVMFDAIVLQLGRDSTFSGRTSLWEGAVAVARESHPVLGAGYRAFWTETGAAEVRNYIVDWVRLPGHGHNGYLDVWLELGYVGVALFSVFVIVTIWRLANRVLKEPDQPAWAAFSIFFFVFLLNNASMSAAFKHTDIAWIFAVLACLYTKGCANARMPARPNPAPLSTVSYTPRTHVAHAPPA